MGITDKILLLLLIILLPLGIVVSRQLFLPNQPEIEDERAEQLKKIELLLDEIAAEDADSFPSETLSNNLIELESIAFASSSGILTVKGRRATPQMLVRIDVVEFQEESSAVQNSAVANVKALGKSVISEAVEPLADGSFTYEYLPNITSGRIEISVEQDGGSFTAGYDLATNTIVYQSE